MLSAARTVLGRGADTLGVTHPDEGVALREGGIDVPILIFRPLLPGEEDDMVRYELTSPISSFEQAERLSAEAQRYGQKAVAHIKIETGMCRTGFLP
ncbi:MAG TPA: alanine racemase, partial [Peptococcaceae bacterium]|nr:alanine racemase [Peptococcaceae bacterium]